MTEATRMADDGGQPLLTWLGVATGARKLLEQFKADGITVTHVVAIPRGGLVLGAILSHALVVPLHVCESPAPWMPPTTLVCDDNSITGESLKPFASAGMPCAVLVRHPAAPAVSPFYFAWESDEMWLFPWEAEAAAEPYTIEEIAGAIEAN